MLNLAAKGDESLVCANYFPVEINKDFTLLSMDALDQKTRYKNVYLKATHMM